MWSHLQGITYTNTDTYFTLRSQSKICSRLLQTKKFLRPVRTLQKREESLPCLEWNIPQPSCQKPIYCTDQFLPAPILSLSNLKDITCLFTLEGAAVLISSNYPFVGNHNFTHRIPLRQNWMPVVNYSTGCSLDLHNRYQPTVSTEALAANRTGLREV